MQKDLDVFLVSYNTKRPHQGRGMKGRTPYQVFKERLPKKTKKTATQPAGKEVKKAA
jgi:hypothetical protein